jgi:hypothetical protein
MAWYLLQDREKILMAAMAMAALGAVSAISQMQQAGKAHTQALKQHGIQQAVAEVNRAMAQSALVGKASQVAQSAQAAELTIEQQAMATEAQAKVNAAAAGVEGGSVDVQQNEIAASEGRAQGALQIETDNAYNQINQESRDIAISADTAKRQGPVGPNQTADMLNIFNSGLSAYLGAR